VIEAAASRLAGVSPLLLPLLALRRDLVLRGVSGSISAWRLARRHEVAQRRRSRQTRLVARIVEPIAPNFAALRRVSSDAERE